MTILGVVLLVLLAGLAGLYAWSANLASKAETAVPQSGDLHPVRGGAIHYVEMGPKDAPPVVLIHGIAGQLQHWTHSAADLLAGDFHVIAVDRPGCGYSRRDRDELAALPEQARMLWEFLDAKGIKKPVLAGHSLGGALALAMAQQRPEGAAALALIAPLTHFQTEIDPIFKGLEVHSHLMRRLIAHTIAAPLGKATAGKVLAHAFAPEPPTQDFMTRGGAALGLRPSAFVASSSDLVMLEHVMPVQQTRYDALGVPGGVLFGSGDALLAPGRHGQPMAQYGFTYEEMPGRGHMLPLTAPQETADFICRMAALA